MLLVLAREAGERIGRLLHYGVGAVTVLREQLLAGRTVALRGPVAETVREALLALGARVAVDHAEVLVHDAAGAFAGGGRGGLRAAVDGAWDAIEEVAAEGWLRNAPPSPGEAGGSGGKIVLIAPRPGAGPFAAAAAAGLENLVRTLSVEWARHGITSTLIAPGDAVSDRQVAELVCFLTCPAGDYFSGCRFELR